MFSGIVEEAAKVTQLVRGQESMRLSIETALGISDVKVGDSIAIEGACLTVVEKAGQVVSFELAPETLRKTTLGELKLGSLVNIERSLQLGERVHGHFVSGHIDAVVKLIARAKEDNSWKLTFELPDELRPYVASKGSVTLAGVSLTVGEVGDNSFVVYVIPHTAAVTTLGSLIVGQSVNCEVDLLARYVVQALSVKE